MNKNKAFGATVVVIALIAFAGATVAFAQGSFSSKGIFSAEADGEPPWPGNCSINCEKIKAAVAEALGISVEELEAARAEGKTLADLADEYGVELDVVQAAIQAARDEALQQAVNDGIITQEQADNILSHHGQLGPLGHRGDRPRFGHGLRGEHSAMAEKLGISVDELQAARAEGKTFADLAEERGIDLEEIRASMKEAHSEALQQAVERGRITQEQADEMLNGKGRWGSRGHIRGGCQNNGRIFQTH